MSTIGTEMVCTVILVLYVSHLHIFLLPHISDREFGLVLDLYERES